MGRPGALDVVLDGKTIFSNKTARRMPTAAEIRSLITYQR
jgi:hypothetical protein